MSYIEVSFKRGFTVFITRAQISTFTRSDSLLNRCKRRRLQSTGSYTSSSTLCVTMGGRLDRYIHRTIITVYILVTLYVSKDISHHKDTVNV